MSPSLYFENKKYLSVKEASSISGYSKDYIGQLSRANKIKSRRVGRNWYVCEESLLNYKNFSNELGLPPEPRLIVPETRSVTKIEPRKKFTALEDFLNQYDLHKKELPARKPVSSTYGKFLLGASTAAVVVGMTYATATYLPTALNQIAKLPKSFLTAEVINSTSSENTNPDSVEEAYKNYVNSVDKNSTSIADTLAMYKNYVKSKVSSAIKTASTPTKTVVVTSGISQSALISALRNLFSSDLPDDLRLELTGPQGPQGEQGPAGASGYTFSVVPPSPSPSSNNNGAIGVIGGFANLGVQNLETNTLKVTSDITQTGGRAQLLAVTATGLTVNGSTTLSGDVTITGNINPGMTEGSVFFQGPNGITEDNSNFFWDDTNNRLGLGTTTPTQTLDITGTLTTSGSVTLGTAAGTTNTFGSGDSSINIIGSTVTPGALTLHGATTLDESFTQTGAFAFSTGTGTVSLNGNTEITGTNTFTVGAGLSTFNGDVDFLGSIASDQINLSGTDTVIDLTSASTLGINTTTNRPVTFGTGLVTIPNLSVTNSQSNNGTMLIDSAATTATIFEVRGNSLTSGTAIRKTVTANAGNGELTKGEILEINDSTTAGGGFTGIGITVSGTGNGSGNKYLLSLIPNTANNEVVFDDMGAFRPTTSVASNTATIGSPTFYWKNGYFDQVTANNIAGTVVSGATSSTTWTIGSTEAGDVNESIIFQRNSGSGNATIQWNAGSNDLRYLSVNYPFNSTYTVTDGSIGTNINLYSGNLTNNTTTGTQRLLSLTTTGTGTTENGIYISNTGTAVTAFEIAGTWTNGIITNNNSINTGTGTITSGLINGQTISSAANFTGSLAVASGFTVSAGTVSLPAGTIDNAELANSSVTYTAGTGLTGGGLVSLGGSATLNIGAGTCITSNADDIAVTADCIDDTQLAFNTGQHLTTTSTPTFAGLTVNGALNIGSNTITSGLINGQTISSAANFTGTVTVATSVSTPSIISGSAVTITPAAGSNVNVNLSTTGDFAVNTNHLYVDTSAGFVGIGTTSPLVTLDVRGTDAIHIPTGTTAERPTGDVGYIRYNTTTHQFEGYGDNSVWQGLGGVIDADQDTYITADTSNADEDTLRFFTAGGQRLTILPGGNVGIGTTNPTSKLMVSGGDIAVGFNNGYKLNPSSGSTGDYYLHTTDNAGGNGTNYAIRLAGASDAVTQRAFEIGNYTGDDKTSTWNPKFYVNTYTGSVGIGTTSPSGKLNIVSTTEQLRLGYDASNYSSLTTGSVGQLTVASGGTNQNINLAPSGTGAVKVSVNAAAGNGFIIDFNESQGDQKRFYFNAATGNAPQVMTFGAFDKVGYGGAIVFNKAGAAGEVGLTNGYGNGLLSTSTTAIGLPSTVKLGGSTPAYSGYTDENISLIATSGLLTIAQNGSGNLRDIAVRSMFTSSSVGIGTTHTPGLLTVSEGIINTVEGGAGGDSTVLIRQNTDSAGASAIEFGFGVLTNTYLGSRIVSNIVSGGGANLHFQTGTGSTGTYTSKLTILRDGNVGIGTTNPSTLLHLSNTTNPTLTVTDTTNTVNTLVQSGDTSAFIGTGSAHSLNIGTNGSGRLVIDSSGNFVFNEDGNDSDFRIESDTNANILTIDAGSNNIGFGASPNGRYFADFGGAGTHAYTSLATATNDSAYILVRPSSIANTSGTGNIASMIISGGTSLNPTGASTWGAGLIVGGPSKGGAGSFTNMASLFIEGTPTGGTNNYGLYQAGSGRNYFQGSVGIGTTNPFSALSVQGASSGGVVSITSGDTTLNNGDTIGQYGFRSIDTDGHVGGDQLIAYMGGIVEDNGGDNVFAGSQDEGFGLAFYTATRPSSNAALTVSEKMRIDKNGNVGIGTATPSRQFSIYAGSAPTMQLFAGNTGATTTDGFQIALDGSANTYVWNFEATSLFFGTNNNTRMTILSGGNVGIGTTNPGTKLDVWAGNGDGVYVRDTSGNIGALAYMDGTAGVLQTRSGGSVTNEIKGSGIVYFNSGNVGIGTNNPNALFQVGSAGLRANSSGNLALLGSSVSLARGIQLSGGLSSSAVQRGIEMANLSADTSATTAIENIFAGITTAAGSYTTSDVANITLGGITKGSGHTITRATGLAINDLTAGTNNVLLLLGGGSNNGTTFTGNYAIYNNSSKQSYLGTGNVGIGTMNPQAKLQVHQGAILLTSATTATEDYYLGIGANNNLRWDANFGTILSSSAETIINIDSDNNDTTRYFAIQNNTANRNTSNELFRVQENGNVGIGTTSPGRLVQIGSDSGGTGGVPNYLEVAADTTGSAGLEFSSSGTAKWLINRMATTNNLQFYNYDYGAPTLYLENSTGHTGIGTTNPSAKLEVVADSNVDIGFLLKTTQASGGSLARFYADTNLVGYISVSSSATAYNTSSDLRLKENISATTMGLSVLNQIQVHDYNFISDPSNRVQGFIAQELHQIYPLAVTPGGDDPVTNPWAVDYSKLAPLLVKSVQELDLKITGLEERVAALEAGNGGSSPQSWFSLAGQFFSEGIKSISDGVVYMRALVIDSLTVGTPETPTGITMYDPTGAPYCVKVDVGGMLVSIAGACPTQSSSPSQQSGGSSGESSEEPSSPDNGESSNGDNGSGEENNENPGEEPTTDTTIPVITLNGDATVNLTVGDTYSESGATANDDMDGGIMVIITGNVDTSIAGTYEIHYQASDSSGNQAVEVIRTVVVSEVTP